MKKLPKNTIYSHFEWWSLRNSCQIGSINKIYPPSFIYSLNVAMSRSEDDSCSSSEDEEVSVDETKVQELENKVIKFYSLHCN